MFHELEKIRFNLKLLYSAIIDTETCVTHAMVISNFVTNN